MESSPFLLCFGAHDLDDDHSEVKVQIVTLRRLLTLTVDRLVGLVVKASASRAEDPGFESRLRRDFFGVESYQ